MTATAITAELSRLASSGVLPLELEPAVLEEVVQDLLATTPGRLGALRLIVFILGLVGYVAAAMLRVDAGVARDLVRGSFSKLEDSTDDRS